MNPIERAARGFDAWQQRHPVVGFPIAVIKKYGDDQGGNLVSLLAYYSFVATFPLLLALTAVLGAVLRAHPNLEQHLVNSAFAEFPIIGGQLHQQLGVAGFGHTTVSLTVGVLGALYGARGFANGLQNALNTVWAVPKVDWPGFAPRYARTIAGLLVLALIIVVTGASGTAAGAAESLGFHGLPARAVSIGVGTVLGFGFFLALFRVAVSGTVPTRAMVPGAAVSAIGWQLLLNVAGVMVAHQLRHAQAVAGFFGVVIGLLSWLALQATLIIYAIEADVVRAKGMWPRSIVQPPLIEGDKLFYNEKLRSETRRPEQRLDVGFESEEPDDRQPAQ